MWLQNLIWFGRKIIGVGISMVAVLTLCFILSQFQPDDPATRLAGELPMEGAAGYTVQLYQQRYLAAAHKLRLDRPKFYFTLVPGGYPDTLLRWTHPPTRAYYHRLWLISRDWNQVLTFQTALDTLAVQMAQLPDSLRLPAANQLRLIQAFTSRDELRLQTQALVSIVQRSSDRRWQDYGSGLHMHAQRLMTADRRVVPGLSLRWHGTDNQFHYWISRALAFKYDLSLVDGRSPQKKIIEAFFWTFSIHLLAALLAVGVSVWSGIYLAAFATSRVRKWINGGLYLLYAMPVFWLGTMAVTFFTTSTYSEWLDWFPSIGVVENYAGGSWWSRFGQSMPRIILPVLVIFLSVLPYLTRQMQQAVEGELHKEYAFFALAKGLTHRQVVWKHVVPNSWFPLLTILSNLLPWLISGSVTIEYIFNIPGMGRLLYDAVIYQDWPVIFALIMLSAILTALGMVLVEWLYRLLDPRVRYAVQSSGS